MDLILIQKLSSFKDSILIGMEDTGHYYFALLKYLLEKILLLLYQP